MSNNPPPYGEPQPGQQPYGPPPGSSAPYGPPPGGFQGQQPAYGTPYGPPGGYGAPAPSKKWYQRWWVWVIAVIALIVIAGVIFAVLRGNKYALESKITDLAKDQGQTISNVKCPDNVDTDKGNEYDCTASLNGKPVTLHVRFVSDRTFTITSVK